METRLRRVTARNRVLYTPCMNARAPYRLEAPTTMPRAASFFATLAHLGWFDLPRPEAPGEDASDAVAR
jgi:hypothetical protein